MTTSPLQQLLIDRKSEILTLADKYGATNIRVFGSVARGEDTESSDIDLLVDLEENRRISDIFALKQDLQSLLNKNIDLLEERSLHWYVKPQILSESMSV